MKRFSRYSRLFIVLGVLVAGGSVRAAGTEFDFKDPKGVNSIAFILDSLVEPFSGVASGISGKVTFDPADPKATKGTISVETKSLHIENKGMKDTMHGPDWLDVAKNPKIEFTFKKVTDYKSSGDNIFDLTVVGDMTCKGVTKELTVPVKATYLPGKLGERSSKQTGDLLVLRANFAIKRKDFGIKPDMPDKVVAEEIQLRVSIAGVSPKKQVRGANARGMALGSPIISAVMCSFRKGWMLARRQAVCLSAVAIGAFAFGITFAGEPLDFQLAVRVRPAIQKGLAFLVAGQQADGGWEAFGKSHPAITALVIKALAQDADYGPNHPAVRRGLESILRYVQPDGGIYVDGEGMSNYHTSVALLALAGMKDPALTGKIKDAQQYLKKLQWDDGEGHEAASSWYGGAGYGKSKRPDLSNTQLMLEALHESGLSTDDPVYKKAMVFVSRCQMLASTNDQPFASGGGDGGFVYSPANGGESKAGTEVEADRPRLRSYGSMTYAAFKSLLYAKVDRNDPRVKAAVDWIRRYYTMDHNPNMPAAQSREGLYYYYHVFARAMRAWGEESITDAGGLPHPWRSELCEKLLSLQREDGSWVNEADRWYEGNPHLVTAYAILALQTALDR